MLRTIIRVREDATHQATGDSDANRSGLDRVIQLITWLLLALASLMFLFRLLTRFFIKASKLFSLEDVLILLAYVFGFGESVTMIIPQSRIFGKDISDISSEDLKSGIKAGYARDVLLLLSLGFAKLSVCSSFFVLSPNQQHRRMTLALGVVIVLWTTSSVLSTAFECGIQGPWHPENATCINRNAFLTFVGITNILTDAVLIAVPMAIIMPLRMALKTRLTVIGFYWVRSLVIAITMVQLAYVHSLADPNFTLKAFPYYISTQFIQFTSITAACVVYFWPFLQSVQSHLMGADATVFTSQYPLVELSQQDSKVEAGCMSMATEAQGCRQVDFVEVTTDVIIGVDRRVHESEALCGYPAGAAGAYLRDW
ncbi:hypothetical protein F4780DRAFT_740544 [Xylariomycetidae sp. FL0641]|nr:hypothetical protein F4780DRAFT_740544 [Xylariomycetidae sp. FL0641]